MGEIRTCKWCGRSYDPDKSRSHYSYAYCSLRCEMQGEKATNNSEARSDRRFMNYFVIPLIIFGVIISIFGDHDEKSDNKKKSAKTERTKNAATTNKVHSNLFHMLMIIMVGHRLVQDCGHIQPRLRVF